MPYSLGTEEGEGVREIGVNEFFIATTPVTQSFWHTSWASRTHVAHRPLLPLRTCRTSRPARRLLHTSRRAVPLALAQASWRRHVRLPSETERVPARRPALA